MKISKKTIRDLRNCRDQLEQEIQAVSNEEGRVYGQGKKLLKLKEDIETLVNKVQVTQK